MKYQHTNGELMRKFVGIFFALCLLLAGCGKENAQPEKRVDETQMTVGLSFPGESGSVWVLQSEALVLKLEEAGYAVKQAYAAEDPQLQNDQIEKLLLQGVDCLVIMAVDSLALTACLDRAEETGVPVIAYQRLLMNTDAVDYYVAYDYLTAGRQIGEYVVEQKQLTTAADEKREYTVEFLMGAPEDNSAVLLYQGVMSILRPYLDNGVLKSLSGRVAFEDTCIRGWSVSAAREHYWDHIYSAYSDHNPDIFCTTGDSLAEGLCTGLESGGYETGKWPLVTGQGGDKVALERIGQGKQSMTLIGDGDALNTSCVQGIQALLKGKSPPVNGAGENCYNGKKNVPALLHPMELK